MIKIFSCHRQPSYWRIHCCFIIGNDLAAWIDSHFVSKMKNQKLRIRCFNFGTVYAIVFLVHTVSNWWVSSPRSTSITSLNISLFGILEYRDIFIKHHTWVIRIEFRWCIPRRSCAIYINYWKAIDSNFLLIFYLNELYKGLHAVYVGSEVLTINNCF